MDRFAAWVVRRHRDRFVGIMLALALVVTNLLVAAPAVVCVSVFLRLHGAGRVAGFEAAACGVNTFAILVFGPLAYRRLDIEKWLRGDRSDPVRAWYEAERLPSHVSVWVATADAGLQLAITVPIVVALGHVTPVGLVALCSGFLIVLALGMTAMQTGLSIMMRPVLDEIAAELPATFEFARLRPIQRKFLMSMAGRARCSPHRSSASSASRSGNTPPL